jgi:hypothetical protein
MTSYITDKKLFLETREVYVFKIVINKKLSRFLEIHFQLAVIRVAKTCLE